MIVKFHETGKEEHLTLEEAKELLNQQSTKKLKFVEKALDHTNHFSFYTEEGEEIITHARVTVFWDWRKK